MTLPEYSQLKRQVILAVELRESQSNIIHTLKELFRGGINSVKRFEQVRNIAQLLQVLELRDILSEDDVNPLKDIAKELKNKSLFKKIADYEEHHEPREYVNYYSTAAKKANKSVSPSAFINTAPLKTNIYNKKKERIYLIVTEQIGSAWKNLGRNLKIQEYKIKEIDDKYGTLATKAAVMLKHFDSRADTLKWHFVLCEALDRTRQKELRRSVQEIMMMNM